MNSSSETKKCPFCSEEIKTAAVKCKFCGEMIQEKPKESEARKTEKPDPMLRNFLIFIGVIVALVVVVGVLGMSNQEQQYQEVRKVYPWLNRCGVICVNHLGLARIAMFDSFGCVNVIANVGQRRTQDQEDWDALTQDKMDDLLCSGSQRLASGNIPTYQPQFAWQNRCGRDCANYIGKKRMSEIDAYSCSDMRDVELPMARNPKSESDYDQNGDVYDQESKAILDKADSINCH
jgi:hypothetical protein